MQSHVTEYGYHGVLVVEAMYSYVQAAGTIRGYGYE